MDPTTPMAKQDDIIHWIISSVNNVPCLVPVSKPPTDTQIPTTACSPPPLGSENCAEKHYRTTAASACSAPQKGFVFTFHSTDKAKPHNKQIVLGRALCERLQAMQPNQTQRLLMVMNPEQSASTIHKVEAAKEISLAASATPTSSARTPSEAAVTTPAESLTNVPQRFSEVLTGNGEGSLANPNEVAALNDRTVRMPSVSEETSINPLLSNDDVQSTVAQETVTATPAHEVLTSASHLQGYLSTIADEDVSERVGAHQPILVVRPATVQPKMIPMVFVVDRSRPPRRLSPTGQKRLLENPGVCSSAMKRPKMRNRTNLTYLGQDPDRSSELLRARSSEVRLLKQTLHRHQLQIELKDEEIKRLNEKLALSQNVYQEEVNKLPDLVQEFIRNSRQRKRGRRFSDKMMDICAKVYSRSPRAYTILSTESDLPFPGSKAVLRLIHQDAVGAGLYAPVKRGPVDHLQPETREELCRLYAVNRYPTTREKADIAAKLDLPLKKVARWYSNKILKENRDKAVEQWCDELHVSTGNETARSVNSS